MPQTCAKRYVYYAHAVIIQAAKMAANFDLYLFSVPSYAVAGGCARSDPRLKADDLEFSLTNDDL